MPARTRLADTRRKRLQQLIDERFEGNKASFAVAVNRSASQVGHWMSGIRNPNGDTCREVEEALSLPRDWLDADPDAVREDDDEASTEAPDLWPEICRRLNVDPVSRGAIDKVHRLLGGAFGRGTIQRIEERSVDPRLSTVRKLAAALECTVADLLDAAYVSSPPGIPNALLSVGLGQLRAALLSLSGGDAERAAEALKQFALSPDSDRALARVMGIIQRGSAAGVDPEHGASTKNGIDA